MLAVIQETAQSRMTGRNYGEKESMDTTLACFRGYADCVEGAVEKGIIYGTRVYHAGEIKDTKCMQEAYMMGKNI